MNKYKTILSSKLLLVFCLSFLINQQIYSQKNQVIDTITILSFNDFHGSFLKDKGTPGISSFVEAIKTIKSNSPNPILLAAGDNFSGNYFTRVSRGEPIIEVFKLLNVSASAIGNHEFDYGLNYLIDTFAQNIDLVAANIFYKKDSVLPTWSKPYKIIEQTLKNGEIFRIAVLGLTTTETPSQTLKTNIEPFIFVDPYISAKYQILNEIKKEKAAGRINMIILLTHIATSMEADKIFEEEDAINLPYIEGVDAIITGHSHNNVLTKINEVPIIQAFCKGKFIGKLQFEIKKKKNDFKISYINGDTIKVEDSKPNVEIEKLLENTLTKYKLNEQLTIAKNTLTHDRVAQKFNYTAIGALVTSSFVDCYEKHFPNFKDTIIIGLNHSGGLRTNIYEGSVTRLSAGNVLPFENQLVAHHLTGKQVKSLLNSGRKNKTGYLQTSYLNMQIEQDEIVKLFYTKSGKNVEIYDNTPCIILIDSFITIGGDGYDPSYFVDNSVKHFNKINISTTNCFINYLDTQDFISNESVSIPREIRVNKK